ncbi:MAG TPA: glycosyltransferase [Pyrinomonadaceae bacterium]|nr:glycosyltransferase [Pyrinomonadaceae bacterium]
MQLDLETVAFDSPPVQRVVAGTDERRLRVLHIGKFYPPHKGGMETHLRDLCQRLARDVDIEVVVANDGKKTNSELADGVKISRLGTTINLGAAPVCSGMARTIREAQADIVHLHFPNPTGILSYFSSGYRGPTVVTYHSDIIRQKILGQAFQPWLRRFLNRSDAIIVGSQNYVDSSAVLRRFRDKCHIIPFGISEGNFDDFDSQLVEQIRATYGPRIVLGIGRLIYYKGFEFLIRSMTNIDGRLLIIGNGPLRASLEAEARNQGVADRVTFLGEVREVKPYVQAADVFALPSIARSEAFGLVQLEAMACGKPVVNTRLESGVPFVSIDGITGLTVPPGDSVALASAINRLLDDKEIRDRMGAAGRLRVQEEFRADLMTARTLDLYREVWQRRILAS